MMIDIAFFIGGTEFPRGINLQFGMGMIVYPTFCNDTAVMFIARGAVKPFCQKLYRKLISPPPSKMGAILLSASKIFICIEYIS